MRLVKWEDIIRFMILCWGINSNWPVGDKGNNSKIYYIKIKVATKCSTKFLLTKIIRKRKSTIGGRCHLCLIDVKLIKTDNINSDDI